MLTGGHYKNYQRMQQRHGLHETVTSSMTTYAAHKCCQCLQPKKKFDEKGFEYMENKFELAIDQFLQDNRFFKDSVRFVLLSFIIKIMYSSDLLCDIEKRLRLIIMIMVIKIEILKTWTVEVRLKCFKMWRWVCMVNFSFL